MLKRPLYNSKGFLGAAKTTNKYPYSQTERSFNMYPLGSESNFIIPESAEKRAKCPRGMKR